MYPELTDLVRSSYCESCDIGEICRSLDEGDLAPGRFNGDRLNHVLFLVDLILGSSEELKAEAKRFLEQLRSYNESI